MIATRTLPSSRRARPIVLPLVAIRASVFMFSRTRYRSFARRKQGLKVWYLVRAYIQLLSDVQDALENGDPRGGGEHDDRPLQPAPGSENEPGGDDDDALRARAEADVAAKPERLRLRAGIRDEEGACDGRHREGDRGVVSFAGEDECDRRQHRPLADSVGGRVEERAERRCPAARPCERTVEDVQHGTDDEDRGTEPVDEELVAILERDDHRSGEAERHARRGQRVRRHPRACELCDRVARERAGAGRVALLDAAW